MNPYFNAVSPGYFSTMGVRLLEGRDFSEADGKNAPPVALVNDRFARHYFGDRSAVGRRPGAGRNPGTKPVITIVGVIENTKYVNLREPVERQVYLPQRQRDATGVVVYVRSAIPPEALFSAIRRAVAERDAAVPVFRAAHGGRADGSEPDPRAAGGLAVGCLRRAGDGAGGGGPVRSDGLQRDAAGARDRHPHGAGRRRTSVLWLVMKEVLVLVAAGTAVGLPAAWALARLVERPVYGVARAGSAHRRRRDGDAGAGRSGGRLPAARRRPASGPMRALRDE